MRSVDRSRTTASGIAGALAAAAMLGAGAGQAAEEPRGLLLRKGMIAWQMPLAQATPLVEADIRPNTLQLLAAAGRRITVSRVATGRAASILARPTSCTSHGYRSTGTSSTPIR